MTQDDVILRGFRDTSDYDTIADIRNTVVVETYGDEENTIGSGLIARISSAEDRICIAESNNIPIGFIYVTKSGTSEGNSWFFTGPTCLQSHRNSRLVEERLLKWLLIHAQEKGVSTLERRIRAPDLIDRRDTLYGPLGFNEVETMLNMRLKLATPPSIPLEPPNGLQLQLY